MLTIKFLMLDSYSYIYIYIYIHIHRILTTVVQPTLGKYQRQLMLEFSNWKQQKDMIEPACIYQYVIILHMDKRTEDRQRTVKSTTKSL